MRAKINVFGTLLNPEMERLIKATSAILGKTLQSHGITPDLNYITDDLKTISAAQFDNPKLPFNLAFACTGGVESMILNYIKNLKASKWKAPFILLTHSEMNSFPAALETKAKLIHEGIPTFLFSIHDQEKLEILLKVLKCRIELENEKRKVGMIGEPSNWLIASNKSIVRNRNSIWGIKFNPNEIPLSELIETFKELESKPELAKEVANEIFSNQNNEWTHKSEKKIKNEINRNVLVSLAVKKLLKKHELFGATMQCFSLLEHGVTGCLALSQLNDNEITGACEGDIPALITMQIMRSLAKKISFMANPIHLEKNSLFLAHCTAPRKILSDYILRTHFESGLGVAIAGNLINEDKPWTISRVNLFNNTVNVESVKIRNVPWKEKSEKKCRTQVEVVFESNENLHNFFEKMSGNHHILTPGDHKKEFLQYAELFGTH